MYDLLITNADRLTMEGDGVGYIETGIAALEVVSADSEQTIAADQVIAGANHPAHRCWVDLSEFEW